MFSTWFSLLVVLFVLIQEKEARSVLQSSSQNNDSLRTTLCVYDQEIGCKTNPDVKHYLYVHSFEEQQIIGASKCVVEDNPTDCNAHADCRYDEDIDDEYNYIFDKPDRQMCVQGKEEAYNLDSFQSRSDVDTDLIVRTLQKCFKPSSGWYLIYECQLKEVCDGVCMMEDTLAGSVCSVDVYALDPMQRTQFLDFSLRMYNAMKADDIPTLTDMMNEDIAENASVFCKTVLPVIFPCIGGLVGGNDASECNLGNPAQFYWGSQAYIDLYDRSQECKQKSETDCERLIVAVKYPKRNEEVQQEDDDENSSDTKVSAASVGVSCFCIIAILTFFFI
eukprot:TRINITY_DN3408_c0_g1_i12.p2 TRINITY_DN3408_c0_g1~~TRINITY_DN3408_c0_g1_i12.p2  ORF type:complete len:334 (-),score=39.52 TRINITY_DN3408_c0_g1_i12:514-1515(-)